MIDELRFVSIFQHHIRFGEAFFDVSLSDLQVGEHVPFGHRMFRLHDGGVILHGVLCFKNGRERLRLHFHQTGCELRLLQRIRRHNGHDVLKRIDALIDQCRLIGDDHPVEFLAGNVLGGQYTGDARRGFRLGRIDPLQRSTRDGSRHRNNVQRIDQLVVRGEDGRTIRLGRPIHPRHVGANEIPIIIRSTKHLLIKTF